MTQHHHARRPIPEQQRCVLDYVRAYQFEKGGVSPSVREIAKAMGRVNSMSCIHKLLRGLEKRGAIRRLPCRFRAIEIIDRVDVYKFDDEEKVLRQFVQ